MNHPTPVSPQAGEIITDAMRPMADLQQRDADFAIQDGAVMLRGSRSRSSGSMAFPAREVCLETGARDMEPFLFGPDGTLYSHTTLHVGTRPVPYTLGYVDFPNGVRVLAPVRSDAAGTPLQCNQPVRLASEDGQWFVTPVAGQTENAA